MYNPIICNHVGFLSTSLNVPGTVFILLVFRCFFDWLDLRLMTNRQKRNGRYVIIGKSAPAILNLDWMSISFHKSL
jgi:hypothetical protein